MGHVFLTGALQIGKSTALRHYLSTFSGRVSGFQTIWNEQRTALHLMPAGISTPCSPENMVAVRTQQRLQPNIGLFDRLGCQLLSRPGDLIVMDELGFLERDALQFRACVLETLTHPTPVLGVVRQKGSVFMAQLQAIPNLTILTVTQQNRDCIPAMLARYLRED